MKWCTYTDFSVSQFFIRRRRSRTVHQSAEKADPVDPGPTSETDAVQEQSTMSAEKDDSVDPGPTSETGQNATINFHGNVYGNIMIGDSNEMTKQTNVPEEIGHLSIQHTADVRPDSDVCYDGEHTNKETGLVCHTCGDTRRNTNDCTRKSKPLEREERDRLTTSEPSPEIRPRVWQIQRAQPKRENLLYGDAYTSGEARGPYSSAPSSRITNYPPKEIIWKNSEDFVRDIDRYLEEFLNATKEEKRSTEQFLLHVVLPQLERKCTHSFTSSDVSLILAKLGCAGVGNSVTTHALELLLELVSHNKLNRHADKLQQTERIIRDSIVSANGAFEKEMLCQQQRRLVLYSRLLILSLIEMAVNGKTSFSVTDEKELREGVVAKLDRLFGTRQVYKKKQHLKLAVEVISEAVERLSSTSSSVREQHETFLQEFIPLLNPSLDHIHTEKKWKTMQKKLCSNTNNVWFDVVMLLHYIQAQETMYPMKTVITLCRLVDGYMMIPEGRRIFKTNKRHKYNGPLLSALAILFQISMTQKDKNVRKDAAISLVKYMRACTKSSSDPFGAVGEIERYVGICLFGKDPATRALLAYHLFDAHNPDEEIPQQYLEHYLEWIYRKHSLEMNGYSVNYRCHFTRSGWFRGVPSVVKTLTLKVKEISQPGSVTSSKAQRDLINEAYFLHKLNANPHPNILPVLAFNTAKPPYHIITEYMPKGTIREYLQSCWLESDSLPSQSTLIKICQDVVRGAQFFSNLHLVHRGLTATNIFIGEDGTCKVAGTTTVRPLSKPDEPRDAGKEETYATPTDTPPEYVSKEEDYPVTHAAPECIKKGRFSTASDVFGIGVFMWEIFAYGCPAHSRTKDGVFIEENTANIKQNILESKKLPKNDCFHEEIYSLMENCWETLPALRPSLAQLSKRLQQLHSAYRGTDYDRPPATPPCYRSAITLHRLPSPLCTPDQEQDQPEFPRSDFSESTPVEGPLYDNGASARYTPCRPQEVNAGPRGYMALNTGLLGEYEPRRTPTQNTKHIPGFSGAPFSLQKPPAPRNIASPMATYRKEKETKDTLREMSSPLRESLKSKSVRKTSKKGYKALSTAGAEDGTKPHENTSNLRERMHTIGRQVFPEAFNPQISGQDFIAVELYDDVRPLGKKTASCQAQDTFISTPLQPEPNDQEIEVDDETYEDVEDVRADIAALQLKNSGPSCQFLRQRPGECHSEPTTNANAAIPAKLFVSGTADKEIAEDELQADTGYYDNIYEGDEESYYELIFNKDNHIYDDLMPAGQQVGAETDVADSYPAHCALVKEQTAGICELDSGCGSQGTEESDFSDEVCSAGVSGNQETY